MGKDYIFFVLHFPALRHSHSSGINQEIDFILGKDFLITTRYDTIDPLGRFAKEFEVHSILDKHRSEHAGYLFFYMIRMLYDALNDEIFSIQDRLRDAEKNIFKGKEREMVYQLSEISRDLFDFKQITEEHAEILESFEIASRKLFEGDFSYIGSVILNEYHKADKKIETNSDFAKELRDTNDSLLSAKQNEIIKTLTVTAFIFLPVTFFVQMFGISSSYVPFMDSPNGFWILFYSAVIIGSCIFAFFKTKKWL